MKQKTTHTKQNVELFGKVHFYNNPVKITHVTKYTTRVRNKGQVIYLINGEHPEGEVYDKKSEVITISELIKKGIEIITIN